jgi:hypothetical protein
MPEVKDRAIIVNIEETFYDIVQRIVTKERISMSAYARNLIIKDLLERGMLTESILADVLTSK